MTRFIRSVLFSSITRAESILLVAGTSKLEPTSFWLRLLNAIPDSS